MFAVPAKTLGVVNEFERNTFPSTASVAPPCIGAVPIPTFERTVMTGTFETAVTFELTVETLWLVTEFETTTLPRTYTAVPDGTEVPTPRKFVKILVVLRVSVLTDVTAKTFWVVMPFETSANPLTARVAPPWAGFVPIPTFERTVRLVRFEEAETFRAEVYTWGVWRAFDERTFPGTNRFVPDGTLVPIPRNEF